MSKSNIKKQDKIEQSNLTATKSIFSTVLSYISKQDMYGQPIGFNYEGSDSFQTLFGGILSIVASTLVLACFIFKSE